MSNPSNHKGAAPLSRELYLEAMLEDVADNLAELMDVLTELPDDPNLVFPEQWASCRVVLRRARVILRDKFEEHD